MTACAIVFTLFGVVGLVLKSINTGLGSVVGGLGLMALIWIVASRKSKNHA
jgi:hypothetical protein